MSGQCQKFLKQFLYWLSYSPPHRAYGKKGKQMLYFTFQLFFMIATKVHTYNAWQFSLAVSSVARVFEFVSVAVVLVSRLSIWMPCV